MPQEPNELSVRQRKYLKGVASGMSKSQASEEAGYSARYTPEKRHLYQKWLNELMDTLGLDDQSLLIALTDGLTAEETKFNMQGQPFDVPNWFMRHRYLETAIKLRDMPPPSRQNLQGAGGGAVVVRHTSDISGNPEGFEDDEDDGEL